MTYYIAIVEEEPEKAVGIWFPDLPGCFTAGDTVEEAMINAREAITMWAEVLSDHGTPMPLPKSLRELKTDPETASELNAHMVALIPFEPPLRAAAE